MSADPSLDLQEAIVAALKGDSAMATLVNGRVYDAVPSGATFPYVSMGADDVLTDDADCIRGYDIAVQIDVWSRAVGQPQMKSIAGAVRDVLHEADLTLDDHALVSLEHVTTRYLRDPDGATKHAAMEFRAFVDEGGVDSP